MCGIAGLVARGASAYSPDRWLLGQMSMAISHRGPDGEGVWSSPDGAAALAHRRLAIVDLTPEAGQPMLDAEGKFCLVFNGEIYNHRALRSELGTLGFVSWRTDHSDTEVLLNAFKAWGIGCLSHLEGMFAFAVWDLEQRELWLVRDRVGVKPVYFSRQRRPVGIRVRDQSSTEGSCAVAPARRRSIVPLPVVPGRPRTHDNLQRSPKTRRLVHGYGSTERARSRSAGGGTRWTKWSLVRA